MRLSETRHSRWAFSSASNIPCNIQQMFRVFLLHILLLFLMLEWRTTLGQHLPAGKNHLHGIHRLAAEEDTSMSWPEHRHLRHIAAPREPQKRPSLLAERQQVVVNGGGEPRPPIAQRVPVPLKEAPSPVLAAADERTVLAMSSSEAEALAQKLLKEAGMEGEEHTSEETPQQQHQREEEPTERQPSAEVPLPRPTPQKAHHRAHVENHSSSQHLNSGERKRIERIQSRWRKIGPLLRANATSSLLPLRRLRLVQHRRKLLHKDVEQTSQSATFRPQHAASADRKTLPTTRITEAPTTTRTTAFSISSSGTTQKPRQLRTGGAPRARQMASEGGRHRVASASAAASSQGQDQFDFESARRAIAEAQEAQKQRLQPQQIPSDVTGTQPKGWEPTLRMLRHRHRVQQQQQHRQRRPPIFNGPLLGNPAEEAKAGQRQFGLRTDARQGNQLEELIDDTGVQQFEEQPVAEHQNRRPVQVERRFRLVPNKVVFRPRLKIRRPGQTQPAQEAIAGAAVARGTDQRSGAPIALPSLGTFGQSPADPAPIPVPPAPEEPAPQVAQPPPPPLPTPEPPPPPPPPPTLPPQPLPAMEIGSVGEQPPQNIPQGGPPTTTTTSTTTTTTPQAAAPPSDGVVLGEGPSEGSGLVGLAETGPLPPGFNEAGSGFIGGSGGGDSGLSFGADLGTPPPGFKESFGLNGFETSLGTISTETTSATTSTAATTTTTESTTTTQPTTTTPPTPPPTKPPPPPPPPALPEEVFIIPENSGLRPVAPPREFQSTGGFGSHGGRVVGSSGGSGGFGGASGGHAPSPPDPPPPNAQVEPPQQPKPEDFFTGESAFMANKRGPEGDGYGPSVLPGAPIPPAPAGPAIGVGGAAAGIPPPLRPLPNGIGGAAPPEPPPENEATTVKPSALLNILNKADEGFNQVITHFEQGTPLEAAAIDIMEVALGSQKLDSQAKLLSHVDRAFGLDNLQRLQRWANTGGALDLLKEQFAKIAKNYKPPAETTNLFTVPPQFEYLFQSGSSGKKRRRK